MFTTGIRYSFTAFLAGTAVSVAAQQGSPLPAVANKLQPVAGSRGASSSGAVTLRPVPRHGMVPAPAKPPHQPQHQGWDLRWRPSAQTGQSLDSQTHRATTADITAADITRSVAPTRTLEGRAANGQPAHGNVHGSDKLQPASRAPELRRLDNQQPSGEQPVAPVIWLGKPQRSDPFATPSRLQVSQSPADSLPAGSPDYFEQPFGDPSAASGSPSRSGQVDFAPDGRVLPTQASQELVPPGPEELDTNNELRGPIEYQPRRSGSVKTDATQSSLLPTSQPMSDEFLPPPSTDQEPAFEPPTAPPIADPIQAAPIEVLPQEADPSLGENDNDRQLDADATFLFPQQEEQAPSIDTLPPPRESEREGQRGSEMDEPAVQAEDLFPGFSGREPTEADLRDRERLNQERRRAEDDRLDSPQYCEGTDFLNPKLF
ncbi:MAG: hypothetical protein JJ992_05980, partial [Planctomycetes bacterium]|nr:hypothetical protein [Planctomycetota bacterium]